MKTRMFEILAAAILVIFALVGGIILNSKLVQDRSNLPDVLPPATNGLQELDLAQHDEISKTEKYPTMPILVTGGLDMDQLDKTAKLKDNPLTMPAFNGEVDLAQMDEIAKSEPYPLTMPAFNGEIDLAQMDEKAKLEAYPEEHPLSDAELKSYQLNVPAQPVQTKSITAGFSKSMEDYTPAERMQYQITETYP